MCWCPRSTLPSLLLPIVIQCALSHRLRAFRFGLAASGWLHPPDQCRQSERTHQAARFVTGHRAGIAAGIAIGPPSARPADSGGGYPRAGLLPRLAASQRRFFRASAQNLAGCGGSIRRPRWLRSDASWSRWGGVQVEQQQLGISHGARSRGGRRRGVRARRTARRPSGRHPVGRPALGVRRGASRRGVGGGVEVTFPVPEFYLVAHHSQVNTLDVADAMRIRFDPQRLVRPHAGLPDE